MKIFADECVYQKTVDILREKGFHVITAQQDGLAGFKNGDLLSYAFSKNYLFLTRDKDFTDIRIYPPSVYRGIVVIKISPKNQTTVHKILYEFLSSVDLNALCGTLSIVDGKKVRTVS